jgi:hypothetical protein
MKNLNLIKPNRLVWEERSPELVRGDSEREGKDPLEDMKKDLYRIRRPQDVTEDEKKPYTYKDFLSKYKDLITTNYGAYRECGSYFKSMGEEVYKEFLELGYVYLNSKNPEIYRDYLLSCLSTFKNNLEMISEAASPENYHPLYKGHPELVEKAKQTNLELMKTIVMDKAKDLVSRDPVALAYAIEYCNSNNEGMNYLKEKTGGFDLSDEDFAEVIRRLAWIDPEDINQEVSDIMAQIITKSKEKPLGNLPLFIQAVDSAAYWAKKTGGKTDILTVVLRRGKKYIEEDTQTKETIEKKLTENGLKLEEIKF